MTERARRRRTKSEPEASQKERPDFFSLTRRVLLAGLGAVALAYDEAQAFVDRLVERGELAEGQARDLLKEVREKHRGRLQKASDRVKKHVDRTLETFDVPRRADLEALQKRLDQLSERVEALLKQREG